MNKQIEYYQSKLEFEMDPSDLFEALSKKEDIIVVDARQLEGYNKEHIPGATSLPHRQINEFTTENLNKQSTYVCYCDGIGCNASTKGALKMAKLGFKVKELIGGIEWWKKDGYATEGISSSKGAPIRCDC